MSKPKQASGITPDLIVQIFVLYIKPYSTLSKSKQAREAYLLRLKSNRDVESECSGLGFEDFGCGG